MITSSGNGVLYTYNEGENLALTYYDAVKDKYKTIEEISNGYFSYIISPEGKTIIYQVEEEKDKSNKMHIVKDGKKSSYTGENAIYPVAVSDDGRYVYFIERIEQKNAATNQLTLYLLMDGEKFKLVDNYNYSIRGFNRYNTECIVEKDNELYLCAEGEIYKLSIDSFSKVCMPVNGVDKLGYINHTSTDYIIYGIDSFKNKVLKVSGEDKEELIFINDKYVSSALVSGTTDYEMVSKDGKSLIYLNNEGDLYIIKDLNTNKAPERLVKGQNIIQLTTSQDISEIYYITKNSDLYYMKKDDKPLLLGSDAFDVRIGIDGKTFYYVVNWSINGGDLFYSTNGKEGEPVEQGEGVKLTESKRIYTGYMKKSFPYDDFYYIGKDGKTLESMK